MTTSTKCLFDYKYKVSLWLQLQSVSMTEAHQFSVKLVVCLFSLIKEKEKFKNWKWFCYSVNMKTEIYFRDADEMIKHST